MRLAIFVVLVAFVAIGSDLGRDWSVGSWPLRVALALIAAVLALFGPLMGVVDQILGRLSGLR